MVSNRITLLLALIIVSITSFAQIKSDSYDIAWKRIDSLLNKTGQVKTALNEVNALYAKAKKENNDAQLIRALIYRGDLTEEVTDNNKNERFISLTKEIAEAKQPAKAILQSILASNYHRYLQNNRYKFYNRTATINFIKDDPATWSIDDLNNKISDLYLASLSDIALLKKTTLQPYDAIIVKGNSRRLRPTLLDLLAHRALDYFKNDERNITKPAYAFEIDDTAAFADASMFAKHHFQTSDSASLYYKALLLFQELISFHLNDADPDALVDADIERIEFIHSRATFENKDAAYEAALQKIINKYPLNAVTSQAVFLLANGFTERAALYKPLGDTAHRYDFLKAEELCKKALTVKDSSEAKSNCVNLLNSILRKEMSTEAELVNVPGKPFRALLSYRNISTVYFRILRLDKQTKQKLGEETWTDDFWKRLTAMQPGVKFSSDIPDTKDHQQHNVEIKIDPLDAGEYALIASADKNFSLKENVLSLQYFYVSNIAYVNRGSDYYVLDRQSGKPLNGADIQIWKQQYDYQDKKRRLFKDTRYTASKDGYFKITNDTLPESNNTKFLDIRYRQDRLFIDQPVFIYSYYADDRNSDKQSDSLAYFFSDRSIYRPGQTVYFKSIVIQKKKNKNTLILPGRDVMVKMFDANGEVVDSISLKTNDFGSCSGRFTLPKNLLNGSFYLRADHLEGQADFRVEEYKRPKFSVEIKNTASTYRLEDTVTVQGTATSFAGNKIDGATVNYRVTRKMIIPYFSEYTRIWPPYRSTSEEIVHGTTKTDANGKFNISFKAIPDKTIPASQDPSFNYEVSADVTDINSETRSAAVQIEVGYKVLKINLPLSEMLRTDSLKNIDVSVTDMNGQAVEAAVNMQIEKLAMPDRMFRNRYWQQPDQFIMSGDEYSKNFPDDLYSNENDKTKWKVDKKVFETSVTTEADRVNRVDHVTKPASVDVKGTGFEPGWYVVRAITKDKFGSEVKTVRYLQLYNDRMISPEASATIETNKTIAEPGDKISYRLITNVNNVFPLQELIMASDTKKNIAAPGSSLSNDFAVTEADRGKSVINIFFVKNNRIYTEQKVIDIPYFNKELKIDYTTFRDKTLPGVPEKWKVKISGYKAEKVAVELLTSMYDASLDQFTPHSWSTPSLWEKNINTGSWNGEVNFKNSPSIEKRFENIIFSVFEKQYDRLKTNINDVSYALEGKAPGIMIRGANRNAAMSEVVVAAYGAVPKEKNAQLASAELDKKEDTIAPGAGQQVSSVQPRTNLNETAFFFPDLHTDSAGDIEFSFTTPEALTTWKWMLLAHTKDLAFGYGEKTMITQKELMVQPNLPRFLRQGDQINLPAKIVNMSGNKIAGNASLEITDALTGNKVQFGADQARQSFNIEAGQSIAVHFSMNIPNDFTDPVSIKIIASAGQLSDGEEAMLPVISNRMLVTETLPLPMKGNGSKTFHFDKLLQSGAGTSLKQNGITIEYTSNPAWYAVEALPYLSQGEKENAEQAFNRYYANAVASKIAGSSPHFHDIINKWMTTDSTALISNLEKNEELKSVLLQETPWVLEAKTETQQKKNIALLFDMSRMSTELATALGKLKDMQSPTGGFAWYKGGPEDRYMTQYILTGMGRLKQLGALPQNKNIQSIISLALSYLDQRIKKDYEGLKRANKKLPEGTIDNITAQYLYMRSFFTNIGVPGDVFAAYNYFRNQSKTAWIKQNSYTKGMIALSLFRTGDIVTAHKITRALKETSIANDELGTYWKDMIGGYYWYEAPIETQSLLIEAISEINNDTTMVDDMKTWLLKNKQTNNWKTTKATADACYALLLRGSDWITSGQAVSINLGDKKISNDKQEAGTGYFKQYIPANEVKPSMGNVSVKVESKQSSPSWGSVYWQYFEDLDKITSASTPLQLSKKLFIEKNTDRGPVLEPLNNNTVHTGDKVRVRIELRADRTMEYVHMKDMRASCMEPVNVLSEYKWQDGLGYYETTKDASTDFFFGTLPKGVYVFEYSLYVGASGSFSNGVTTIQCMYAPEFSSQSEGIKLRSELK